MRGGKRSGAGRKSGSLTKKTAEIAEKAASEGITPLEYMLEILRGEAPEGSDPAQKLTFESMRFEAAKAAAPYVHPRLAAVELSGNEKQPVRFVIEQ